MGSSRSSGSSLGSPPPSSVARGKRSLKRSSRSSNETDDRDDKDHRDHSRRGRERGAIGSREGSRDRRGNMLGSRENSREKREIRGIKMKREIKNRFRSNQSNLHLS